MRMIHDHDDNDDDKAMRTPAPALGRRNSEERNMGDPVKGKRERQLASSGADANWRIQMAGAGINPCREIECQCHESLVPDAWNTFFLVSVLRTPQPRVSKKEARTSEAWEV
jgi:hypothetical protein